MCANRCISGTDYSVIYTWILKQTLPDEVLANDC